MTDAQTVDRPAIGTDLAIIEDISEDVAHEVITEIARGNIRHTRISY